MKKILIIVICIFSFTIGQSQDKVRIGFNGGINISKHWGNQTENNSKSNINGNINIQLEYYFKEKIALKTGLSYERHTRTYTPRGFTYTSTISADKKAYNDYIGLYGMSKFEFSKKKFFYLQAGGFFDFLLSEIIKEDNRIFKNDLRNNTRINSGIMAGFGFQIPIAEKHRVNIEIVEKLGLVNLTQNPISSDYKRRTTSLGILVGWNMGL